MVASLCQCGAVKPDGRKPCERCKSGARYSQPSYGTAWDKLSREVRIENPLCERCDQQGRTTPAASVHHVIPLHVAPQRKLDRSNLMSVCRECHEVLDAECDRVYGGSQNVQVRSYSEGMLSADKPLQNWVNRAKC